MRLKEFNPRQLVHTPAEMMAEVVEWAEDVQENPGVKWGIPAIDRKVIPMYPGTLTCLIARPGMAKTSLMIRLAREEAKQIVARGMEEKEAVIYTTWEQTSEELSAMLLAHPDVTYSDIAWGRADLGKLKKMAVKGAQTPVYIIGHGITRKGEKTPRMTTELVYQAIRSMESDFGIKPRLMLFDYLQLIPTEKASMRVQQVTEMPIELKELSMTVKAAAIAAVQASRDVDKMDIPIPEIMHAQWASSIEQTGDKVFSLLRPIRAPGGKWIEGDHFEVGGETFVVNSNLLIIRLLKQRGEEGAYTWGMFFDPALMRLADLERVDLEEAAYRDRETGPQKVNYSTEEEPHKPITF